MAWHNRGTHRKWQEVTMWETQSDRGGGGTGRTGSVHEPDIKTCVIRTTRGWSLNVLGQFWWVCQVASHTLSSFKEEHICLVHPDYIPKHLN